MSHQDKERYNGSAPQHQALKQALDWLLDSAPLSKVAFREDCKWTPKALIFTAILWAWSDEKTLTDRFATARKIVTTMGILREPPAKTYQAFLKILKAWTGELALALVAVFRRLMQTALEKRFMVGGFAIFGVDGSRLELPRTASNEQRFSPAKARTETKKRKKKKKSPRARSKKARAECSRQKKVNSPQMWLTMMFHVVTGLPWDWRTGPSDSSERDHFRQMIDALTANALVTADAGFVGYECWKAVIESGRHFLIRVGSNVRLLKNLGYAEQENGLVYLWPDREARRKHPPLVLRLVVAAGGKHPVYLVTSVLDDTVLSDKQVVEIYSLRWKVELFFRNFKQTFERCKLRSHTADNAELEATWALLGFWGMMLHAEVQLTEEDVAAADMSVAKILRAYRKSMREYQSIPERGESLCELISKAVTDWYKRKDKSSREYPRKKHVHVIGAPEVKDATPHQIKIAREIRDQSVLGLTA